MLCCSYLHKLKELSHLYSDNDVAYSIGNKRARCRSLVERLPMLRWVVGSIPHGGRIDLFLVPANALQRV